jgi:hypothetical protein
MKEYNLKIGDTAELKKSFLGSNYGIAYAGKPNETVFSLVVTYSSGYNSLAYNLYYQTDQKELRLLNFRLTIMSVRPEEIRLRVVE